MPRVTVTEIHMFLRYMLFYFYLEFVNFLYLKPRLSRIVRYSVIIRCNHKHRCRCGTYYEVYFPHARTK